MAASPRAVAVGAGFGLMMALATLPLVAQDTGSTKTSEKSATPPAKRVVDPSRRVPDYFGQIGLTPEQKETIYKIQAKHLKKIDELEKQIREVKDQMLLECEGVLNDTQKQLLEHRRKA